MDMADTKEIIDLVHQARGILLDQDRVQRVFAKGAADYVTEADKSVQAFLADGLARLLPDAWLYAEEKDNEVPPADGVCWILDPVDGTTNLIHDYRFSAVSLALCEQGEVTLGVVYNPFSEETYTAKKGEGAFLNGKKLSVSGRSSFADSLVSFGASPYRKELAGQLFPVFQSIFVQTADFRRAGSAALELCYVAAGRLDAYFEGDLKPWDYAAGQLIVREAGGLCTTFTGEELPAYERADLLAATPGIYEAMAAQVCHLSLAASV